MGTLREIVPDSDVTAEAEATLRKLPWVCPALRRVDLYRMGAVVTDRLCLSLMAANFEWPGGCGLRWLRLDLRFGAAAPATLAALSASSTCSFMELRLLPTDPALEWRQEPVLAAIPRVQAAVRAHRVRRALRHKHEVVTRLQAAVR